MGAWGGKRMRDWCVKFFLPFKKIFVPLHSNCEHLEIMAEEIYNEQNPEGY